jgi:hypothetical protein
MTETLETVTKKKPEPTAEQAAAEELVRRASLMRRLRARRASFGVLPSASFLS